MNENPNTYVPQLTLNPNAAAGTAAAMAAAAEEATKEKEVQPERPELEKLSETEQAAV